LEKKKIFNNFKKYLKKKQGKNNLGDPPQKKIIDLCANFVIRIFGPMPKVRILMEIEYATRRQFTPWKSAHRPAKGRSNPPLQYPETSYPAVTATTRIPSLKNQASHVKIRRRKGVRKPSCSQLLESAFRPGVIASASVARTRYRLTPLGTRFIPHMPPQPYPSGTAYRDSTTKLLSSRAPSEVDTFIFTPQDVHLKIL